MATIQEIAQPSDWNSVWAGLKEPTAAHVMLFKFSPRCPTSHFVERVSRKYVQARADSPTIRFIAVDVVNARPTSLQIATDTGVRHESPQAIFLAPGQKVLWNASHEAIDDDALDGALKQAMAAK